MGIRPYIICKFYTTITNYDPKTIILYHHAGLKTIKLLPVSYFLATKFEAFRSRGNNDPYVSHDFEDIIYVLDNNIEVGFEIAKSQNTVINFMKEMAAYILNHPSRNDIIATHINPYTSKERIPMLIEKLSQIQEL